MNSRRDFLQKISASTIAFAFLPRCSSSAVKNVNDKPYDGPVLRIAIFCPAGLHSKASEQEQLSIRNR